MAITKRVLRRIGIVTIVFSFSFQGYAQIIEAIEPLIKVRGYKDLDGDGFAPFNAIECTIYDGNLGPDCVNKKPYDIDDSDPNLHPNTLYYLDADFDGYYTTTIQWNESMPIYGPEDAGYTYVGGPGPGGLGTWTPLGIDCNDGDANIHSPGTTIWYHDIDGDGYPNGTQTGCTRPGEDWYYESFYLGGGKIWQKYGDSDCDDNNVRIHDSRVLYHDNDGDGYHDGTSMVVCDLTTPAGYTATNLGVDCDDNDPSVYRTGDFYQDLDGDNHLVGPFNLCYGASTPTGYLTDQLLCCYPIDCDDNDPKAYKSKSFFVDNDGDFYVESEVSVDQCGGSIFYNPPGYVSEDHRWLDAVDCDDNNASVGGSRTYYKDNDGDGFTTDTIQDCSGSAPAGYKSYSAGIDCDDNNASAYTIKTLFIDNDGDNYTAGESSVCASNNVAPAGFSYTSQGIDCNDNDPLKYVESSLFIDLDGDGYTDGTVLTCTSPIDNVPGHRKNSYGEDCDDTDASKKKVVLSYVDADGDNYRANDIPVYTCGLLPNHTTYALFDDCDDNDPAVRIQMGYYYVDIDGDGYGTGDAIKFECTPTPPPGYSTTNDDCNDNDPQEHPNAKWFADVDNDLYKRNTFFLNQCERPTGFGNYKEESELLSNDVDCNDANAQIGISAKWYRDIDGDGYGTGISTISCSRPSSHYLFSELTDTIGDCKDTDPAINPGTAGDAVWYRDVDGDGFGIPSDSVVGCVQPAGYVANKTDCDDNNTNIKNIRWYKDADLDGYYDGTYIDACSQPSASYKLIGDLNSTHIDCYDDDAQRIPNLCSTTDYSLGFTAWSLDSDNDRYTGAGYPSTIIFKSCVTDCRWVNTILPSGDCDDNNHEVTPNTTWYKDEDGDGYGTGQTIKRCAQPAGYELLSNLSAATGDCDDTDNSVYPGSANGMDRWFRDADNDGFGDVSQLKITCNKPVGYVADSTDCDDSKANISPITVWYEDIDGDFYSSGNSQTQCSQPSNHFLAVSLIETSGDCNDNDITINPRTVWYKDGDNDNYSDGTDSLSCSQPIGYKSAAALISTNSDCDDNNSSVNPLSEWYRDADADGYGTGDIMVSCAQPSLYYSATSLTATSGDCNDGNSQITPNTKWFADMDDDGYGNGTSLIQCSRPNGYKLPSELIDTVGDCNENNSELLPTTVWYQDFDGDGAGNPATPNTSCEAPNTLSANDFVTNGDDCDDTDSLESPGQTWYADIDGDNYSSATIRTECVRPLNHKHATELTGIGNDCNDNNTNIHPQSEWFKDEDGDGYSDGTSVIQCNRPTNYLLASALIATTGDCNDNDPLINPTTVWYADVDVDGLGDPLSSTIACVQPAGYVANNLDCNDAEGTTGKIDWFRDFDADGYGNGTKITQCTQPVGYQLAINLTDTIGDCNDNNIDIHPNTVWNLDADKDGYGTGSTMTQCVQPINHYLSSDLTSTTGDCDDANKGINPSTVWYKDIDGDGYSDSVTMTSCTQPLDYYLPSELTAIFGDCDDNNTVINPKTIWYKDEDGDGYSDGIISVQCTQPIDYYLATSLTAATGDCNDNDGFYNPTTVWYKDTDNDDYSDGVTLNQCTQPAGYDLSTNLISTTNDCDDSNSGIEPNTVWYEDLDGDGFGAGVQVVQCSRPLNHFLTSELSATTGDCDDNYTLQNPITIWYHDNDGDGYSDGTSIVQCAQPANHYVKDSLISTFGDCDDNNASIFPSTVWFKDADADGYGSGDSLVSCTQPVDYYLEGNLTDPYSDCDDSNSDINPTTIWHQDMDADSHGIGVTVVQCNQPVGHVLVGSLVDIADDCDDTNPLAIDPSQVWYEDMDGDGYSSGNQLVQCTQPIGYNVAANLTTLSGDCDDSKADRQAFVTQVSIAPDQSGCVAQNTSVTYSATPGSGGSFTYAWSLNGSPAGSNQDNYIINAFDDADEIIVELSQSGFCSTYDTAYQQVTPQVSLTVSDSCLTLAELKIDQLSGIDSIYWMNGGSVVFPFDVPGSLDGTALSLDGVDDMVEITNAPSVNVVDEFTLSAWVKTSSISTYNNIFRNRQGGFSGSKLMLFNGRPRLSFSGGSVMSDNTINDGEWHFVTATFNNVNDELNLYIDGALVKTETTTATPHNLSDNYVSMGLEGGSVYAEIEMDEISFFHKTFTEPEVQALMQKKLNSSHPDYDDLLMHYNFNEGSGSTVTDNKLGTVGNLLGAPEFVEGGFDSYKPITAGNYSANIISTTGCSATTNNVIVTPVPTWYLDADGDGYGTGISKDTCKRPANYYLESEIISTNGDCDDNRPEAHEYVPNVTISSSQPTCSEGQVDFTATPETGGGFNYEWRLNFSHVGTNSANYSNSFLEDGSSITVKLSKEGFCETFDTLIQSVRPQATLTTNDSCIGLANLVVDNISGIDTISWRNNSNEVNQSINTGSGVDSSYFPNVVGLYTAEIINASGCTIITNEIIVAPEPTWYLDADGDGFGTGVKKDSCKQPTDYYLASNLNDTIGDCDDSDNSRHDYVPNVNITSSQSICGDGEVTFQASPANTNQYSYSWAKFGSPVGTNSDTYSDATLLDASIITVELSSTTKCSTFDTIVQNMNPVKSLISTDICLDSAVLSIDESNLTGIKWILGNDTIAIADGGNINVPIELPFFHTNSFGIDIDAEGNMYIANSQSQVIKYAPGASSGIVVAGRSDGASGSGPDQFAGIAGIHIDNFGNIYVADGGNSRIQKWAPGASSGVTVAGGNGQGSGLNKVSEPADLWVDDNDTVYVLEQSFGGRLAKWGPGATEGIVVTTNVNSPRSISVDNNGDFIITQGSGQNNVVKVTKSGVVTPLVGVGTTGNGADELKTPVSADVDSEGNLYVVDRDNRRIQKFAPGESNATTLADEASIVDNITVFSFYPRALYVDNNDVLYFSGTTSWFKYATKLNNNYTPVESGVYKAQVTNPSGCSSLTNTVEVHPGPNLEVIVTSDTICTGDEITITATGADSFNWANGIINGVAFIPDTTKEYNLIASNSQGCTSSYDQTIVVNENPQVEFTTSFASNNICQEDSIIITTTNSNLIYELPVGINSGVSFLVPGADTNFTLSATDMNGCYADTTVTLLVHDKPDVSINLSQGSAAVCSGDSITLNGVGADSYVWTNNVVDGVSFVPIDSGNYVVTGTDASGCFDTDTIFIQVSQQFTLSIDQFPVSGNVCSGSIARLTASGGDQYTWNNAVVNDSNFVPASTDTYVVIARDTITGCTVTDSVTLTITGGASSADTIQVSSCESYVFFGDTLTNSGTFQTILSNAMGCDSTLTLELIILEPTDSSYAEHAFANYNFNGTLLTSTGIYRDTLVNANFCDSIVILDLTIFSVAGDIDSNGVIDGVEIAGDANGDGIITLSEFSGDINGNGVLDPGELFGDVNGNGIIDNGEITGDHNGSFSVSFPEITGDVNGNGVIDGGEISGDINGNGVIDNGELSGDVNGNGVIDNGELGGDVNGDLTITIGELSGDINGNGIIDSLEVVGDVNNNGVIDNGELSGDVNGNGIIDNGEITGDLNGDGVISGPTEQIGDVNGNGIIDNGEIPGDVDGNGALTGTEQTGDINANGVIDPGEISGDVNNNGIIDAGEVSGDVNGNGAADHPNEISGDVNGNGIVDPGEIVGDVNGNGTLDSLEIAGDISGNGVIDFGELGGDVNGNSIIDPGEVLGDLNGNGIIDGIEVVGDINGNGIIDQGEFTGDQNNNGVVDPGEIVGDFNGNGVIDGSEVSGDINGNGVINSIEITGDVNGNGLIDIGELSGDINGNGVIDVPSEIAGDINGNLMIDSTETTGDINGNGLIDGGEISGDVDGNGSIALPELTGDVNGNGIIDSTEIAGNTNGNSIIDGGEITGDVNNNGVIDPGELPGDVNGNGIIDAPTEVIGDVNGDGVIGFTEISGDVNGNGLVDPGEIVGDVNGNGTIDSLEITGDVNGDGQITTTEVTGDANGNGVIDGGELPFDINGNGVIDFPEIVGDLNGNGIIDGTEITGDVNGNGIIDGGEITGDVDGNGIITPPEFTGDIDGNGTLDPTEVVGDIDGTGTIDNPEITGDVNGDGVFGIGEFPGDINMNGIIDGSEISGDVNNNGTIDSTEIAGDVNGNGIIDGTEIAGDVDGNGFISSPSEVPGDVNGNGIIDGPEIAGDVTGDYTATSPGEIAGDINNNGIIDVGEFPGDLNGNGVVDTLEITGDINGNGLIEAPEISGDGNGNGTYDVGEISGDINNNGTIDTLEIAGDINGNGVLDHGEISGDVNGNGIVDIGEVVGDINGNGLIDTNEIAGNINGDGQILIPELTGDINGNGIIDIGEVIGDINGNGIIDSGEITGDNNGDGSIDCYELDLLGVPFNISITNSNNILTITPGDTSDYYIWIACDHGNAVVDTFDTPVLEPDSSGIYSAYVIRGGCTRQSSCETIDLLNPIINKSQKFVEMYPNPTNGNFELKLSEQGTIRIYTLQGKTVLLDDIVQGKNAVNISDQPNGLYLLDILFKDGDVKHFKLVIEN